MRRGAVLGLVASSLLIGCRADTADDAAATRTIHSEGGAITVSTDAPAEVDEMDDDQVRYDEVLAAVGVAVATAPDEAVLLDGAQFCGWDRAGPVRGSPRVDLAGRRCFVQAHLDGRSAVFLIDARTNEGDPVPGIYRTDGGHVTEFADTTRDNYGTKGWSVSPCDALYVASYDAEAPSRLWFSCVPWEEADQL